MLEIETLWNLPFENFSVKVVLYQVKQVDLFIAEMLIIGYKTLHNVVNQLI